MINIALCNNRKDKIYKNYEMPFTKLIEKLKQTTYTDETYKEYLNLPKDHQDNIKDVGGFVGGYLIDGKRSKCTVKDRSILTLDVDYGYPGMMEFIEMSAEFTCAMYTTHKHNSANERFRIVIPLSRKVDTIEYEALGRIVANQFGIDYFDDTTYEPSRLMYFPSTSKDGDFKFIHIDEQYLEVEKYLKQYENYKDKTLWPKSSRVQKIQNIDNQKQQNPLQKQGIIGAFCKTYNIHEVIEKYLSGVYIPTIEKNRYTYKQGSSYGGLIVYEDCLFAYSHHSTDPCCNKLCNAFDLVKNHKFKGIEEEKAFESMVELVSKDINVIKALGQESLKIAASEFSMYEDLDMDKTNIGIENKNKKFEDNSKNIVTQVNKQSETNLWVTKLEVNKKGIYTSTIDNIVLIMENDENLKGKIALNEFSHQIVIKKNLPWRKIKNVHSGDCWCDNDDSNLRHYIERVYKIKSQQGIYDGISVVANKHCYHPIKDYLSAVKWDGVNRVDNLFVDYLGAQKSKYTSAVTRKILVAAASRIFNPGVKFDNMVVFVGKQGLGKSHFLDLIGKEWYSDSINTVVGKEAYEQLQEAWIVEMAELSATKKAETESVKHFISKREDVYRVAYGRRVEKFKRQCVFFGTTNDDEFLKDKTGNRRFWPVKIGVNKIEKSIFKALNDYEIDNIWAEVVEIYKGGESLILNEEEASMALKCQEQHLEISPKEGMIREYLEMLLPKSWDKMDIAARRMYVQGGDFTSFEEGSVKRERVCAMEIWVELFSGDPRALTPFNAREINDILRSVEGWKAHDKGAGKLRFGSIYGNQRAFVINDGCDCDD